MNSKFVRVYALLILLFRYNEAVMIGLRGSHPSQIAPHAKAAQNGIIANSSTQAFELAIKMALDDLVEGATPGYEVLFGDSRCNNKITSSADCEAAARALGFNWDGDRSWSDRYAGCTRDAYGKDVNFNTRGDGSAKMGIQGGQVAVCKTSQDDSSEDEEESEEEDADESEEKRKREEEEEAKKRKKEEKEKAEEEKRKREEDEEKRKRDEEEEAKKRKKEEKKKAEEEKRKREEEEEKRKRDEEEAKKRKKEEKEKAEEEKRKREEEKEKRKRDEEEEAKKRKKEEKDKAEEQKRKREEKKVSECLKPVVGTTLHISKNEKIYYKLTEAAGLMPMLDAGSKVKVISLDGKTAQVKNKDGDTAWVPWCVLTGIKPPKPAKPAKPLIPRPTLPTYVASGCRRVKKQRIKHALKIPFGMTLAKCYTHCHKKKNVKYFGVTKGSTCFCSTLPPGEHISYVECDMTCSGNLKQVCGGVAMASSVYTIVDCDSPKGKQAEEKTAYINNLLGQYASFKNESCGQAADNLVEVNGSPRMAGSIKECKLACWEARGAETCHGFTYDGVQSKCTFHADVLNGKPKKDKNLSCYYKTLGFKSVT